MPKMEANSRLTGPLRIWLRRTRTCTVLYRVVWAEGQRFLQVGGIAEISEHDVAGRQVVWIGVQERIEAITALRAA